MSVGVGKCRPLLGDDLRPCAVVGVSGLASPVSDLLPVPYPFKNILVLSELDFAARRRAGRGE